MPKGSVIQDMLIFGKGRNLSMKVFLDAPNSLIQATKRNHAQEEGCILVMGIK